MRSKDRVFRAGAYAVESVDESGAGDAFAAGFIIGLIEQWPLEQTLRLRKTPAERWLELYHGEWAGDLTRIFDAAEL